VRSTSYTQGSPRKFVTFLRRPPSCDLSRSSEPDPDGSGQAPRTTTSGHIDITGIAEAAVLAGPGNLTMTLEDGRRLAFDLTNRRWTRAPDRSHGGSSNASPCRVRRELEIWNTPSAANGWKPHPPVRVRPLPHDELPMPSQNRVWCHDGGDLTQTCPASRSLRTARRLRSASVNWRRC
jgi:hypothetical protein